MTSALNSDLLAEIPTPAALDRVQSWLTDLAMVAAARPQAPVAALVASRRGCSLKTVYNKLYAVERDGPLALLDRRSKRGLARVPTGHRSPRFIQHVHSLYFKIARNNATPSVQDLLLASLRAWRRDPLNPALAIPGYDSPPPDSAESRYRHPFGWSLRNLNEMKPTRYQQAEGRLGRHHSNALLPPVLTTRVGLLPGECYLFDDQHYDLMVHWGDEPVRPLGLNCLDLASGCDVARGMRPELPGNPDGEKALTRAHTLWLVIHILTVVGYYHGRCKLVFESGSSSVDEEFKRHIALATDNRVTVDIGEVSKEVVRGVLLPSKGNPRFKAPRESWFNLLRNRMGFLPLALGMDRDHKPEDTDRLVAEDRHLLQVARSLPPSVFSELRTDGLPWSRFALVANAISEGVNQRTEHDLEGWAACGRERVAYRVGGEWIDESAYLQLPPETRALLVTRMRAGEVVSRLEKASPREVFDSGLPGLRRVSPFRWHLLIPAKYAIARTVPSNRMIVVSSRQYSPDPIQFQPFFFTESGEERPMPANQDVLLFLSPVHPEFCLVTRTDGRPYGLCFAVVKGTRFDEDALLAQYAQRNRLRADLSGTAAVHNQLLAREREERRESNAAIAEAHGADPKAVAKIRRPSRPKKTPSKPRKNKPAKTNAKAAGLGIFNQP